MQLPIRSLGIIISVVLTVAVFWLLAALFRHSAQMAAPTLSPSALQSPAP